MKVTTIKTHAVRPGQQSLNELLDAYITELPERSIVAIASKVVAICEGRVVPVEGASKDALVKQETSLYLPSSANLYGVTISVTHNLLVASGGIDESNADGHYILWPADKQASANAIRAHLAQKFSLKEVGVVITDSTSRPFQWGTTGLAIAHSGFSALKSYIGDKDIFGRSLQFQTNNIMNGLAVSAVLLMGEGNEQTPIAIIEGVPFVEFQPRDPSAEELATLDVTLEEDIYGPMLKSVPWKKGDGK